MSMKMMNAAYLVDNVALLSLQEKQDGVEFHCFDMGSKVQIAEGHIGWDALDKQPFSTLEESGRMAVLQKIPQLAGLTVAPVAPEMLEQMRGGRKVLWQMKKADPELENAKNIRFITSSYEDRFKIPDGSAVEIEYPNRKFSARCEYMDEYHLRLGYDVLHICQLAEMLERGGGTCRPEPLITEECSAWDLGSKGFLAIQTCEDGYDYTLYHMMFMEEHGIKSYAELKEQADGISEKCDALLESVKADEARMSEVSVLRKHLINYAKTKDVFAAYKASGYNREFYEAHRDTLALRSAAKKAFDDYKKENGSDKKLPRISELNAEYAMLLERKKSSYAEYRKTKSEMQDWLVAQKIVQEILKEDEQKKEQLHEQEEENRQSSR